METETKDLMRSKVMEINNLHKEVDTRFRAAINDIKDRVFRIGELLTECKKEYGTHGLWMAWVAANCEFSYFTANNYINAYERKNDPNFELVKNLKDIYYPQIEHKPEATKVEEPEEDDEQEESVPKISSEAEPLPVRLQPPVTPKVEEPEEEPEKEDEWLDEPLTDRQDEWVECIKDLYVKLDDDHKGLVIDWILEYKEAA